MTIQDDPAWFKISASKVGRTLFVKMPVSFVPGILIELDLCFLKKPDSDLREEIRLWAENLDREFRTSVERSERALVLKYSVEKVKEDLNILSKLGEPKRRLVELINALRGGLENQPDLDWISRVRNLTPEPPKPTVGEGEWDFF